MKEDNIIFIVELVTIIILKQLDKKTKNLGEALTIVALIIDQVLSVLSEAMSKDKEDFVSRFCDMLKLMAIQPKQKDDVAE